MDSVFNPKMYHNRSTSKCRQFLTIVLLLITVSAVFSSGGSPKKRQERKKLTAYDERYAKRMAALAAAAYALKPNDCIRRWMPDPHSWRFHTHANDACDALGQTCVSYTLISEHRREMVVVFRGTVGAEQLFLEGLQSMKPGQDFHGMGKVNYYFNQALNVLWTKVEQALREPSHANFVVSFTGHSLGGALAALAAAKTVAMGLRASDQVKLYTFGQPRVGNSAFATKFDQLIPHSFRVIFRKDIVPHLPRCRKNSFKLDTYMLMHKKPCDPNRSVKSYHHGTEIWYPKGMPPLESNAEPTEDQHYIECVGEPHDEDFACSYSVSFEMHHMQSYFWDHRNYFGHHMSAFGKMGCAPSENEADAATKLHSADLHAAAALGR